MLDHFFAHPFLFPLLLIASSCLYLVIRNLLEYRAITKLGSFAPRAHSYLPFGVDILYRTIRHSHNNTDIDFWEWLFAWSPNKHSKTVEVGLARQRWIFTADPGNIKAILATQFQDFGKGKRFHEDWKPFLGDSIFTTDGQQWHDSRQLIRPQFAKNRIADLEIFERHVERLMNKIGGRGEEVDIAALFYRFTLDSATDYLLGKSVDSLDNPHAEFASAFAEVQKVQNMITRSGEFNALIPKGTYWAGLKIINAFVEPFIEQVLRLNVSYLKEKTNPSFLDALAATGIRDRNAIRDQVIAVLLAGRDTTAGALSFTFQELSAQPEIVRKLRREILDKIGASKPPSYEDLKSMPYLQHVMNETLRLYPSVPFNVRQALCDTTLPTGGGPDGSQPIGILKGTTVGYSAICMQRREDLYPPPSADFPTVSKYSPERWDKWTPKTWTYLPFNGGPRICVGQQFALTEMGYTIVRILQRFDRVSKYWQDGGAQFKSEVILSPKNGVQVGFWEREIG
ncbi:MAG: hypothetical protein ALECFALPRED_003339 [Alectoria fallacina]|uniref:Cytochrome P450 n=1 Tax=Alectoria fallacina TaxID=1903189 RepID=A0A8H3FMD4_9LECA|nr:MAG: hypothetical protein ALECFALPRED_003339 [Alectoria fallacina]